MENINSIDKQIKYLESLRKNIGAITLRNNIDVLVQNDIDVDIVSTNGEFEKNNVRGFFGISSYKGKIVGDGVIYYETITSDFCGEGSVKGRGETSYEITTKLIGKNLNGCDFCADVTGIDVEKLPEYVSIILQSTESLAHEEVTKKLVKKLGLRSFDYENHRLVNEWERENCCSYYPPLDRK